MIIVQRKLKIWDDLDLFDLNYSGLKKKTLCHFKTVVDRVSDIKKSREQDKRKIRTPQKTCYRLGQR